MRTHRLVASTIGVLLLLAACERGALVRGAHAAEPLKLPPATSDRVLVVGVDAATWDVLHPLVAVDLLPTFARLMDEGYTDKLISMEPSLSPALWTTIATGKRPEQHGIRSFLEPGRTGDGAVPVTTNLRRAETLWTIASRAERRVNVIGWYVTWPAEPVAGVMVSDRFGPTGGAGLVGGTVDPDATHPAVHPPERAEELARHFVRPEDFLSVPERHFHEMTQVYPTDAMRVAVTEELSRPGLADLTMVYLRGIDPVQHLFWKAYAPLDWVGPEMEHGAVPLNRGRIPEYYRDVDGWLARLLALLGPRDTLIVVSDHGAGPIRTWNEQKKISGDHRPEGVIIAWGNHVRPRFGRAHPSILDVAPTVLHLLGLPHAEDMPGRVIEEMLDEAFLETTPMRRIATYEPAVRRDTTPAIASDVDAEIKDQLRALGYIE